MGSVIMTKKRKIPTEEEFERAEKADAERNRGLSPTRETVYEQFKDRGLDEIILFYHSDIDEFIAYVSYKREKDIALAEESGLTAAIKDRIYEELEKHGRGSRNEITLTLDLDSYENVEKNYEGNYYLRLR